MCLMGRVTLGACFSATFGMLAAQANGPELWWAPVPGMVLGSTFGVVLGMHPDSMPSASLVAVCFLSALATNPPAAYLLPSSPDPFGRRVSVQVIRCASTHAQGDVYLDCSSPAPDSLICFSNRQ